jgi:hypothetical protein
MGIIRLSGIFIRFPVYLFRNKDDPKELKGNIPQMIAVS